MSSNSVWTRLRKMKFVGFFLIQGKLICQIAYFPWVVHQRHSVTKNDACEACESNDENIVHFFMCWHCIWKTTARLLYLSWKKEEHYWSTTILGKAQQKTFGAVGELKLWSWCKKRITYLTTTLQIISFPSCTALHFSAPCFTGISAHYSVWRKCMYSTLQYL